MVVITLARSVFVFLYHYSYRYDLQTSSETFVHFSLPRSFRRRLRNDLSLSSCVLFSSSLLLAESRAHLPLLYLTYFCCNRYKNETKKETLSSEIVRSFCLPRSFRRRLRNDLSLPYQVILSSLLLAEPRAHLLLLYLTYFCCKIQKRREKRNY